MIGYNSILFDDVRWRNNQGGLFLLSPPCRLKHFDNETARQLLKTSRQLFIRWESDFDNDVESPWWHVIRSEPLLIHSLGKKMRYQIRRGINSFRCEPASRAVILSLGYEVYKKAFTRYKTHEKEYTEVEFLEKVSSLPEQTEFWGVWSKNTNELVAFSENYVEDTACYFVSMWFDPSSFKDYSSYILLFEMISHYINDRNFRYVSNGSRSLSHDTNIHEFLINKFGFYKAHAKLNVEYVSWLRFLVTVSYPFHLFLGKIPLKFFQKVSILLAQEKIRRSCAK